MTKFNHTSIPTARLISFTLLILLSTKAIASTPYTIALPDQGTPDRHQSEFIRGLLNEPVSVWFSRYKTLQMREVREMAVGEALGANTTSHAARLEQTITRTIDKLSISREDDQLTTHFSISVDLANTGQLMTELETADHLWKELWRMVRKTVSITQIEKDERSERYRCRLALRPDIRLDSSSIFSAINSLSGEVELDLVHRVITQIDLIVLGSGAASYATPIRIHFQRSVKAG